MSDTAVVEITKEEFCARFKTHMLKVAGPVFDDGESIADYADGTAPTYWDERADYPDESPEELAEADMSYWGD
jgi:hypothetical protein